MTRIALVLLVLVAAGCGSHKAATPESVARAWSAALNRGDDETAATYFSARPEIVQGDVIPIGNHQDLEDWNASLPCGGTIERVIVKAPDEVLVVFRLTERPHHACDGPGQEAAALFRVDHGKIVLWHQTALPTDNAV